MTNKFKFSNKTFIIAEIGMNHNGSSDLAKKTILAAKKSGANAVKFQTFDTKSFINNNSSDFSFRKKHELSIKKLKDIVNFANKHKIIIFSTPFDIPSLKLLIKLKMPILKIASSEIYNTDLITEMAKSKKQIIMSTGYAKFSEIIKAYEIIKNKNKAQLAILHCVSSYPTKDKDLNFANIDFLQKQFPNEIIGYSDHSLDPILVPSIAVSLGAKIIEKHFTLDNDLDGYDHKISLNPEKFKIMVQSIRRSEKFIGYNRLKTGVIKSEFDRIKNIQRSLHWKDNYQSGKIINSNNIIEIRPGGGLPVSLKKFLIGNKIKNNVKKLSRVKIIDVK